MSSLVSEIYLKLVRPRALISTVTRKSSHTRARIRRQSNVHSNRIFTVAKIVKRSVSEDGRRSLRSIRCCRVPAFRVTGSCRKVQTERVGYLPRASRVKNKYRQRRSPVGEAPPRSSLFQATRSKGTTVGSTSRNERVIIPPVGEINRSVEIRCSPPHVVGLPPRGRRISAPSLSSPMEIRVARDVTSGTNGNARVFVETLLWIGKERFRHSRVRATRSARSTRTEIHVEVWGS